jgi:aminoglycoside 6'-N-acetyltransferase I
MQRRLVRELRPALTIRPATKKDFSEWARLRRALWPDCKGPRAELEMAELFRNPKRSGVLVIDRGDGTLAGFVELALRDGVDGARHETTGYVEGWYVEEPLRGKGWGRKLIAAAGRWAKARGMSELASDAELANEGSIAAHRALGFRETYRVVQFLKRLR